MVLQVRGDGCDRRFLVGTGLARLVGDYRATARPRSSADCSPRVLLKPFKLPKAYLRDAEDLVLAYQGG
jgi:hypothetical protein